MYAVTAQWDRGLLKALHEAHGDRGVAALVRALAKAGGDAARGMRTTGKRVVRDRKRFKAAAVAKDLALRYPASRRHVDDLAWKLEVLPETTPMSAFRVRQTKKGVSALINKGKRSVVKGAFIATMKSGHRGVFVRAGSKRLPIRELFTSRVVDVFRNADAFPRVAARASETFSATFARVLPLELAKL